MFSSQEALRGQALGAVSRRHPAAVRASLPLIQAEVAQLPYQQASEGHKLTQGAEGCPASRVREVKFFNDTEVVLFTFSAVKLYRQNSS